MRSLEFQTKKMNEQMRDRAAVVARNPGPYRNNFNSNFQPRYSNWQNNTRGYSSGGNNRLRFNNQNNFQRNGNNGNFQRYSQSSGENYNRVVRNFPNSNNPNLRITRQFPPNACYECGELNHFARNCPRRNGQAKNGRSQGMLPLAR